MVDLKANDQNSARDSGIATIEIIHTTTNASLKAIEKNRVVQKLCQGQKSTLVNVFASVFSVLIALFLIYGLVLWQMKSSSS